MYSILKNMKMKNNLLFGQNYYALFAIAKFFNIFFEKIKKMPDRI